MTLQPAVCALYLLAILRSMSLLAIVRLQAASAAVGIAVDEGGDVIAITIHVGNETRPVVGCGDSWDWEVVLILDIDNHLDAPIELKASSNELFLDRPDVENKRFGLTTGVEEVVDENLDVVFDPVLVKGVDTTELDGYDVGGKARAEKVRAIE